ncbi:MAG: hypothetical protein FRX49_09033 [Trebouxia sp. A1-2]|nr:MAG: hypothetical protein FRX49_09033 [Trebouxia sp. A1-2]
MRRVSQNSLIKALEATSDLQIRLCSSSGNFHSACTKKESKNDSQTQATQDQRITQRCAEELVQQHVHSNDVVGLGTGVLGVRCIPASDVSASEAAFQGVPVTSLAEHPVVDVMFEEVDEIVVQEPDLPFIAGRLAEPVQPNLLRMRALLSASKHKIVLIDGVENTSARLRGVLPVLVDADYWEDIGEVLDDIFIPDAEIWRRSVAGYDPTDPRAISSPYLSAQGHNVLDVKFYGPMKLFGDDASYSSIAEEIEKQAGIITHGLFVNVANSAAMFTENGIQLFESAAVV